MQAPPPAPKPGGGAPRAVLQRRGQDSRVGGTLLAHNEHWLAGDVGNVAVIVDAPDDGRVPIRAPRSCAVSPRWG